MTIDDTADNAPQAYLALDDDAVKKNHRNLQVILANTIYMYQLYKKYHWHVTGKDFYQYHLLFDKHADEQPPLIDAVAERMRTLGLDVAAMPMDVSADATLVEKEEAGHDPQAMVRNLLAAHEEYLRLLREAVKVTEATGDDGTNDLLVSDIMRVHELQTWFIRSSVAAPVA